MGGRLVALRLAPGEPMAAAIRRGWERGDALLPLPSAWPEEAVTRVLARLRPDVLVDASGEQALDDALPTDGAVGLVIMTSGSTGAPKAVELDRAALEHAVDASLDRLGAAGDETWLSCLPFEHVAGVLTLLRAWRLGSEPVVQARFDPDAVAASGADHVSLVPTMLVRLLDAGVDLAGMHVLLGGAPAGAALLERARSAGATVTVSYGMTETCGGCVYDGVPLGGVGVRVSGGGGIEIAGPVLMRGYRNDPDATAAVLRDGWLRTNDLGAWDSGRLQIRGRLDDVIITGGENVLPAEVEAVVRRHPKVADVAVVGVPDEEWGERIVAVCVARDPDDPPEVDDLRAFVRAHAPPALIPREFRLAGTLPRTSLGKIDRSSVREGLPDKTFWGV